MLLCASLWRVDSYQNICHCRCALSGFGSVTIVYTQLEKLASNVWLWERRIWAEVHFAPHVEQCNLSADGECVIRLIRCNAHAAELEGIIKLSFDCCCMCIHINMSVCKFPVCHMPFYWNIKFITAPSLSLHSDVAALWNRFINDGVITNILVGWVEASLENKKTCHHPYPKNKSTQICF